MNVYQYLEFYLPVVSEPCYGYDHDALVSSSPWGGLMPITFQSPTRRFCNHVQLLMRVSKSDSEEVAYSGKWNR
jgi:hypothetical protein